MAWFLILSIVATLIFLTALYVAAEFSTVSARRSRLGQFTAEGHPLAAGLIRVVEDPAKLDAYIATCQIGITISSVVLGYYGQSQIATGLAPWLANLGAMSEIAALSISVTGVLLLLSLLHILFGELVPKNIGLQYPEQLALATYVPVRWSSTLFKPLIWLFNGSGQGLMRLFGKKVISNEGFVHTHLHAPEEILLLVEESSAGGLIQREERRLLKNILQMREVPVRQVMIPRTRMLAAPANLALQEMFTILADSTFSRLPLYNKSVDNIIGVVHLKDLLFLDEQSSSPPDILSAIRPTPFIPESMTVKQAFALLQRNRYHLAIVLDEFGGTAGMVSLEDLIEEIFGELQDEFDTYTPRFRVAGNRIWIRGDTLVEDLEEYLAIDISDADADTIGGLVLSETGHIPKVGEEIDIRGTSFRVEKMTGRGVASVSTHIGSEQAAHLADEDEA